MINIFNFFFRWLTLSADHIVILILLLALTVKFIVFEGKDEITEQILMSEREEHFAVTATHEPGKLIYWIYSKYIFSSRRAGK